ncbi:glutamate receptor ionotropic, delta-2-like [Culex pipiens pallens]|uniref:glutamate receptor ionotropic, delta-2-like n=1 Tax=Culex pipiens pallens TaxID=42434 RepID=UPI00195425F7|nr:glutamate receptor ionotropic, delta-2-like [Culex pipiens pallens]
MIPNATLFHDKTFDLGGRTIRTGVIDYIPYCSTSYVGANQGNADAFNSTTRKELQIDGLDGSLIVEFCKLRNCNLKLWPFGPDKWGNIYENGTGEGMMYSPYAKETEFAICCLYYSWVSNYLDFSKSIAFSSVLIMVPRAKLLPTIFTPLYPFNPTLWLVVFITLVIMTVVHHGITTLNLKGKKPPVEKSIFDIISVYLDQGIFPNTTTSSYRILISFMLLSGVVLSNSYAGGLASVLTIPRYEKSLETIHDFVQSPYRWGAPAIAWILSLVDAESIDLKTVVHKFDIIPDVEDLHERLSKADFGIGIELLNSQKLTVGPYIREDNVHSLEMLKQLLYYDYTGAVSQRGWPLMEPFDNFVLEAIQHGLVIHWEEAMLRKYQTTRMEAALDPANSRTQQDDTVQALTVEHILGPIFILLVGTTLATGIFILEVLWHSLGLCLERWHLRRCETRDIPEEVEFEYIE